MEKKKIYIFLGSLIFLVFIFLLIIFLNKKTDTYKVTFVTNSDSIIESQVIKKGGTVTRPNNPIKDGFVFDNWYLGNDVYDFSTIVEKDITLTAAWTEIENDDVTYVITFDSNGGSYIDNQIVLENALVNKPNTPTKDGYKFVDWYLNDNVYDFNSAVTSNITLVAKWEKVTSNQKNNNVSNSDNSSSNKNVASYSVTFNSNGGSSVPNQTVKSGEKVSRPSNPTKAGYSFGGWLLNGNIFDFNSVIKQNITLTAKWDENVKNNYVVTFNSNGGTSVSNQNVLEGNKVVKPGNPTKEGYKFVSWTLNNSNYDFNSAVTSNITLVASWAQKSYVVKVTSVDDSSPARILTVYEDGVKIVPFSIKYSDGTYLCSGTNANVNKNVLTGETSLIIVLSSNTEVIASIG